MAAMTGLPLVRIRVPNSSDGSSCDSMESETGLHVVWGDIESHLSSAGSGDGSSTSPSNSKLSWADAVEEGFPAGSTGKVPGSWGDFRSECRGYRSERSGTENYGIHDSGNVPRRSADVRNPRKIQNKRLLDCNTQSRSLANAQSGSGSQTTEDSERSLSQEGYSFGSTVSSAGQQLKVSQSGESGHGNPLEQQVTLHRAPAQNASNAQQVDDQEDESASEDTQDSAPAQQHVQEVTPQELAEITAKVRRNEKGQPTSLGSEGHEENCKACLFVFTAAGCSNGVLCPFCHFKHKRANRPRPCKDKRNRFRKLAAQVEQNQVASEMAATENRRALLPAKFTL